MNVLLLAAFEDDLEAIWKNIDAISEENENKLFYEALKGASMKVITFFLKHGILKGEAVCINSMVTVAKHTRPKQRYAVMQLLLEHGCKDTQHVHPALYYAAKNGDIATVLLLRQYGFTDKNGLCLRWAILKDNETMFWALWPKRHEDQTIDNRLFQVALSQDKLLFALLIFEAINDDKILDTISNEKTKGNFLKFVEIVKRTKIRAVNKIGTWWIPICYDLNRECGKRMMERSWERIEKYIN
jgi:hypothetical protein